MPLREDEQLSKAYFPDRLPPSLTVSDAVIETYGDAMWALGRLDGLGSEVTNPGAVFGSFVYKEGVIDNVLGRLEEGVDGLIKEFVVATVHVERNGNSPPHLHMASKRLVSLNESGVCRASQRGL